MIVSLWVCVARHDQKYRKQPVYNIFAKSQEKREGYSYFLLVDECQRFLQSDTLISGVCG